MSDFSEKLVSARDLASLFGLSERRIRQLVDEGGVVKASHGKYMLGESVRAHIEYRVEQVTSGMTDEEARDYNYERTRKTKHDADLAELKVEEERGRLMDRDDVLQESKKNVTEVRERMLSAARRIAKRIASGDEQRRVRNIADDEIRSALEVIASGADDPRD